MFQVLLVATLTGGATAVGAFPFLMVREIGRSTYDTLLGFGAGLMLAAATLGLLPAALRETHDHDVLRPDRLALVIVGFVLGALILFFLDRLIPHQHAGGHHHHMHEAPESDEHSDCNHRSVDERARHHGLLILGAMSLHRLPEGFAIGAGFATAEYRALGILLTVATALQNAIEGAIMAAPLKKGGFSAGRLFVSVAATGLAIPVAAVCGYLFSQQIPTAMPLTLALAAGALIYLTCSEIIPESHSHGHERRATVGVLSGFLLIIIVKTLVGRD